MQRILNSRHTYTAAVIIAASAILSSCSSPKQLTSAANDGIEPVITHTAEIETSMGTIVLELYGQDAPKTVRNFVGLAEDDVYDDILFHRVVPGFVIQAGDPNTKDPSKQALWGTGGTTIYDGQKFEDELNKETPSYKRGYVVGVVAMANSGPNTNSSQFFIGSGPQVSTLPYSYTIFGYVRSGMEIVQAMEKVQLKGSIPKEPIKILDIDIEEIIEIK